MHLLSSIKGLIRSLMSSSHSVDEIIYINLDSRIDRARHTEAQLTRLNIPFDRFSAVTPTLEELVNPRGTYRNYFLRSVQRIQNYVLNEEKSARGRGVLGCYLSHYEVLQSRRNCSHIFMILEDDVHFSSPLMSIIQDHLDNYFATIDWDMIRVIWSSEYGDQKYGLRQVSDRIFIFDNAHTESRFSRNGGHRIWGGSHFQLVNRGKADKILRYMDEDNVYAIDSVYSTNKISCYALDVGELLKVGDFGSDIPKL